MKKILFILLWGWTASVLAQEPIELITYNIRLNTPGDGEHAWPHRKEDVAALFRFHRASVFCVQEALPDQMDDLQQAFPGFASEGVGRDDGVRKGEFSAVFYDLSRFQKLDGGTFWLSETPDQCSLGWDAAFKRVCSWVRLKETFSGYEFFVFNTHFDHRGEVARRESAKLILRKIESIAPKGYPVVLCGDFNLPPDSGPIGQIKTCLKDAFEATELPPYGSVATYHGFTYDDPPEQRIDYVFVSEGIHVLRYAALTDSRDRSFFSDHLPVLVTLKLQ
jgi:endonuclease/exonuclease/phosphatase family metal-dependent hydrolase